MRVFVSLVLVLVLIETRASPIPESEPEIRSSELVREECLQVPLSLQNKTKVSGQFYFLHGFTDNHLYRTLLNLTSSFWVNITETESGLTMEQFNKMNGTCLKTLATVAISGDTGIVTVANMTSQVQYFSLGDSSLVLDITASSPGVRDFVKKVNLDPDQFSPDLNARAFYLMSHDPVVSDSDLELFRLRADCKGFRGNPDYVHKNQEYCSEEESILMVY
ncbi:unnamed protein product [Knipowitschia caucasica]|uniref:Uncharacterized protein n=1 Tax=Knipowitschia caucasica TaxID=637954 RepID=A0AAV2K236_KNICA